MLQVRSSSQFKKDTRRLKKQGKNLSKLKEIIMILVNGNKIPARYGDHSLRGKWKGYRDLHLEPDWVLLYSIENGELVLATTGSHAELFQK